MNSISVLDEHFAYWLHVHTVPWLIKAMKTVSRLHNTSAIVVALLLIALFLLWRRERYWLLNLILVVPGGMLLNTIIKLLVHRARPSFEFPLILVNGYSFPSGHTASSTLLYGFLAALIIAKTSSTTIHKSAVVVAVAMVAMVGFSRLYLGAHYLSDVLAAFLEGMIWLALCLKLTSTFLQSRGVTCKVLYNPNSLPPR